MSNKNISVVMPVYNAGKYLIESIQSTLSHSFSDFEFIIVNDGSTDGSTDGSIDTVHLRGDGEAIVHPSVIIRREPFIAIGGHHCECAEDVDHWLRLAEYGVLASIKKIHLYYRQHLDSIGCRNRFKQVSILNKATRNAYARRWLDSSVYKNIVVDKEGDRFDVIMKWGWWLFISKNYKASLKYSVNAVLYNFLNYPHLSFFLCR